MSTFQDEVVRAFASAIPEDSWQIIIDGETEFIVYVDERYDETTDYQYIIACWQERNTYGIYCLLDSVEDSSAKLSTIGMEHAQRGKTVEDLFQYWTDWNSRALSALDSYTSG